MIKEFKAFVMRGNVLDLAVAVIIGAAFGAVVKAFTDGVLMALVAALVGKPDFDDVTFDVGDGTILIGSFLTELVNFLLIAFVLFLFVKAANRAMAMGRRQEAADAPTPAPSDEAVLLTEIRDLLARTR